MRKAFLIISIVIAFAFPCFSAEWKGKVVSIEGKPIAAAVVFHQASGLKAVTDKDGWFSLVLPQAENVSLKIVHPDYMEEEVNLGAKAMGRPAIITLVPYIQQREEVVVMAMRHPEPSADVPAASTVVSAETIQGEMVPNIAKATDNLTGVTMLGTGGFSLVPSIRGLARRRVLLMVDNARLSSDRRTGPSASFISPEDVGRIEVLRSPG
jgi:outer membrane receptor protein involved in Fe transport